MLKIFSNGIMLMNKGDNISLPFFINQGTPHMPIRYSLLSNHSGELYIGVMMPNLDFENALIRKKYTYLSPHTEQRDVLVDITPLDTMCLKPGRYYIEAKLRVIGLNGQSRVFTVMPKKILQLLE